MGDLNSDENVMKESCKTVTIFDKKTNEVVASIALDELKWVE